MIFATFLLAFKKYLILSKIPMQTRHAAIKGLWTNAHSLLERLHVPASCRNTHIQEVRSLYHVCLTLKGNSQGIHIHDISTYTKMKSQNPGAHDICNILIGF